MSASAATTDLYLTEAVWDAEHIFGPAADVELRRFASIVFKPDAIVGRRIERAIGMLAEEGFRPLGSVPVLFGRHIVREEWCVDGLVQVPRVIRNLVDLYMEATESLWVGLRCDAPLDGDASQVLRALKGPSKAAAREARHLRRRLDSDSDVIAFIHTPDSHAAFVRELGLFLGHDERRAALGWMRDGGSSWRPAMENLYARHEPHDLDHAAAIRRIEGRIATLDDGAALACRISNALAGQEDDPETIFHELADFGVVIPIWDRILFLDRALRHLSFGPKTRATP
jgi:hypothetical protein